MGCISGLESTVIGGVLEPVEAEAAGGDLLSTAVTEQDIARARQITSGMQFGRPADQTGGRTLTRGSGVLAGDRSIGAHDNVVAAGGGDGWRKAVILVL